MHTPRLLIFALLLSAGLFAAESEKLTAREHVQKGSEQFFGGKIDASIKSFEQAIAIEPKAKAHLWQVGISYYYAGRFAEGRDLFELHQTVNPQDVENAVWHFLCVARLSDIEAARQKLIPISGDTRVPMKQIHALFSGSGSIEDVLKFASNVPDESKRKNALCYAHLYLGLYEEARGNTEKSSEHIKKAAEDYRQDHYMGQVARVHHQLRAPKQQP